MFSKSSHFLLAFLLIVVVFLSLRIPFLRKDYAPEEVAWIRGGEGMAQTGFPWTYLGEQAKGLWAGWKGPLFPWALGIAFRLFGSNEAVARSVPLIFSLGQIILVYLLSIRLFGKGRGNKIGIVAALFLAVNPFTIQGSLQIDIDGGLVAFFSLLLLYNAWPLFAMPERHLGRWLKVIGTAIAMFLTRFDVSLMMFFSVILFAIIEHQYILAKKFFWAFIAAIAAAALIFLSYGALVGELSRIIDPFRNIIFQVRSSIRDKFGVSQAGGTRLYDVFPSLRNTPLAPIGVFLFPTAAFLVVTFTWITLPLSTFIVVASRRLIKNGLLKISQIKFLFIPTLVIFIPFAILAPSFGFPRYIISSLVIAIIILAYLVVSEIESARQSGIAMPLKAIVIAGVASLSVGIVPPLNKLLLDDRARSSPLLAGALFFITIVLACFLASLCRSPKKYLALITILCAIYLVFTGAIITKDIGKPYSLNAYYGNYGFKEAGEFIKTVAKENSVVLAVDTIGYYYGGKYYDATSYLSTGQAPLADFTAIYTVPAGRFSLLTENKKKIASFGTVEIYAPK